MRLGLRFVLYIGVAAVVPIGLLGWGAARLGADSLLATVAELQGSHADALAGQVDTWVGLQLRMLGQQSTALRADQLSPDARTQWLRLIYRQAPELALVVEITPDRKIVGTPARVEGSDQQTGALASREVVDDARLTQLINALNLDALGMPRLGPAPTSLPGPAIGSPYLPDGARGPVLPVAIALAGNTILGAELSLEPLARTVAARAAPEHALVVLSADGRTILGDPRGWVEAAPLRPLLSGAAATSIRYRNSLGVEILAACSPVPGVGWTVVVAEPVASSTAAVRQITHQTLYIALVASLLSVVVGILFARQLAGPVVDLKTAALAVAEGDYGRRLQPEGSDEVTELARAFNFMSTRLEDNAARISAQSAEIEAFNAELQARVDARTRELSEAQDRLVQSARLAAVGEMGAGLAHELNNPMAGILGLSQVLSHKRLAPAEAGMVRSIEAQAKRCKEIIATLLGLSMEVSPPGDGNQNADLHAVVAEVAALVTPGLRQRGLSLTQDIAPGLQADCDRAELGRALAQVLMSVRAAAAQGGELTLTGGRAAGIVWLDVTLVAPVIAIGSDDWMASGMGLWAARRSLADQRGRLLEPDAHALASTAPVRVTWRVELPAKPRP